MEEKTIRRGKMNTIAWREFEKDVSTCLANKAASRPSVSIHRIGGSTSNASDIEVTTTYDHFFVECKYNGKARFGQTVLRQDDDGRFIPSGVTKPYWQQSIDALNAYAASKEITRSSLTVPCSQEILNEAVTAHYDEYGVRFIVTGNKQDMRFIDLEHSELRDFFEFTLHVRRKLSGSRRCSSSDAPLLRFLSEQGINATFQRHGTHLYLIAPSYAGKLPLCFSINDRRYRIAPNDDGECEIRRLSNTDNITMLIGGTFIDTDCTDGEQSIDAILCQ